MPKLKEIHYQESIVPSEAYSISASFRNEANRVRELANLHRQIKSTLDYSWEGNSKNRFSNDFDPQIGQLDNYANMLEEKARQIENIHVNVWKTRWEWV